MNHSSDGVEFEYWGGPWDGVRSRALGRPRAGIRRTDPRHPEGFYEMRVRVDSTGGEAWQAVWKIPPEVYR